jgi:hypothetical protein
MRGDFEFLERVQRSSCMFLNGVCGASITQQEKSTHIERKRRSNSFADIIDLPGLRLRRELVDRCEFDYWCQSSIC